MSSWVNRTALAGTSVNPNGTTSHTVTFAPATSGNFLVAVVAGAVTFTTPPGWTLQQSGVNFGAVYVFTKIAGAGESSFSTTHNSSNYAIKGVVYEFYAGSTYVGGNSTTGQSRNVTVTGPATTGLTGTYTRFTARSWNMNNGTTTASYAWTIPSVEDYDAFVAYTGTTDGISLGIAYDDNQTAASFTPSSVLTADGSTTSGESITFAIVVAKVRPTLVASYDTLYDTNTSPKTLSVTTQPGDWLVVYGGEENGFNGQSFTPSGNGVSFTQKASVIIDNNWGSSQIWAGVDNTGGTNWTLSATSGPNALYWGFSCLVFRNSDGPGAANGTNVTSGAPTLAITTTGNNSAIVVFNNDWTQGTGTRTWRTVNGVTPTNGNGLETTYETRSGTYTVYGAYYDDAGIPGSMTVGLSAPTGQKYSIVALEMFGQVPSGPAASPSATIAWLTA